jgi:glutamate racemase
VFDSGVGGLSVLKQIVQKLPHEDVIFLADTARVPYGGRPPAEIIKINQEIIPFLIDKGAKLIVMACGTSSAIAYPVLKDAYPVNILNIIDPGVRAAVNATKSGKIGIFATVATINSQAFQTKIKELKKEAEVHATACPLFVPLIEGGFIEAEETKRVAKEYLKPLLKEKIDTLILGCTHYPHLSKILSSLAGPGVTLVDPAEELVIDIKNMLKKAGSLTRQVTPAKYEYFVTGSAIQFQDLGSRLMGKPIVGAKQVTLT